MKLRLFFMALLALAFAGTARATSLAEAETALEEAVQLRAAEFAPGHYGKAREKLEQARSPASLASRTAKAEQQLAAARQLAEQASETAQRFSKQFSELVEARDRLQLTGAEYVRNDLAERSEKEFAQVVAKAEDGNAKTAKHEEKLALVTFRAAQTVAGREQFVRPISRAIARARKTSARRYAPAALEETIRIHNALEQLIKSDPDAQTRADSLSKQGQEHAGQAIRISGLGSAFSRDPGLLESWVNANDRHMGLIGELLGVQLSRTQTADEQLALLRQAVLEMKTAQAQQLNDADTQIRQLARQLAESRGAISRMETDLADMAEVRRRLRLKREAEAKIRQLAGMFDPAMVEMLLTPDADVILRMKALNFRSGSAVIPLASYALLDNVIKSIEIFPGRDVRVEGHTDSVGATAYNQELSERRAGAVGAYLGQRLPRDNSPSILTVGHGEERPIANNETVEGRTKNRRIDIVLAAPRG